MTFEALKIGVIGVGRWGGNLLRCFGNVDTARVVAVCDADPSRLRGPASPPGARCYRAVPELLRDAEVQAVVIATPAVLHAEHAVAALEAGKHVFVEKPVALSLRDAQRIRDAAVAADRRLMVGHLLRYHPAVLELERLVTQGRLGRVHQVGSLRLGPGGSAQSEGPWWSLAPHDISVVRFLLGAEFVEVSARRRDFADGGSEVTAELRSSGAAMTLVTSTAHPRKIRRLALVGTRATAVFEDNGRRPLLAVSEQAAWLDRAPGESMVAWLHAASPASAPGWSAVEFETAEPLLCEARHFVSAVKHGQRVLTDANEGCQVVAVLEAGALSMSAHGAATLVPAPQPEVPARWAAEQEHPL